jgi:hypothetical protein
MTPAFFSGGQLGCASIGVAVQSRAGVPSMGNPRPIVDRRLLTKRQVQRPGRIAVSEAMSQKGTRNTIRKARTDLPSGLVGSGVTKSTTSN